MRTDWNSNTKDFEYVIEHVSFVPSINLFVRRLKKQPKFKSYKADPECGAIGAIT